MSRTIHLWCPSVQGSQGGIESYSLRLAAALRPILGQRNLTVLVRNDREADVHAALGDRTMLAAMGRFPKALWAIAFAAIVVMRALRERPDLIITTHLNFAPFAAFVRKLTGIPYWVVLHGYEAWEIQRSSQRRAVIGADLLLPVSNFTRERVIRNYAVPATRLKVLPNTFDPARFGIGPKPAGLLQCYALAPDDKVILTVGRLSAAERYKGHDRIIRALPRIRDQLPKAKYLIVGTGDDRRRLAALAEKENVSDAIIFAGRVAQEDLPDYYRLCDLYAMPSTGEGFGIVFLEALACGKPVLAGNRDGAVDALLDGELGVLVDPDDNDALAHAAIALLVGCHSHPMVGRAQDLRDRVIAEFGPEKFQQTVAQLLSEIT